MSGSLRVATVAVFTVGAPANRMLGFALLVLAALPTLLAASRLLDWQLPGSTC